MGCDIHEYIELVEDEHVRGIGRIYISRDYELFSLLAGVRGTLQPLVEPKGLPDKLGWETECDYILYITDNEKTYETGTCIREKAEKWIKEGIASYWKGDKCRITNPDWHSASYLSLDELKEVAEAYWGETGGGNLGLAATIAAMEVIEKTSTGKTRLVFWFDS